MVSVFDFITMLIYLQLQILRREYSARLLNDCLLHIVRILFCLSKFLFVQWRGQYLILCMNFWNKIAKVNEIFFRHITSYIKKHGINPANGKKLSTKDLIRLNFAKDSEGKVWCLFYMFTIHTILRELFLYKADFKVFNIEKLERDIRFGLWKIGLCLGNFRCPVTYRVFTLNSLIVAIKPTGNVYSMEAVDELNLKRNYLKDLLNDTPFQRKDIIVLQVDFLNI